MIVASTKTFSRIGEPTEILSPSLKRFTASILILSPSSPWILSTTIFLSSSTLYCFPPLVITA